MKQLLTEKESLSVRPPHEGGLSGVPFIAGAGFF